VLAFRILVLGFAAFLFVFVFGCVANAHAGDP
jgi:hypothetical protein